MTTTETKKGTSLEQLIADYRELIKLCRGLTPEEWNAPSLCEGWRVRDVVAHLVAEQKDWWVYFTTTPNKANQKQVDRWQKVSTDEIVRQLEGIANRPGFLVRRVAAFFLYESWIHQQDIRWPLGKERKQDPDRVRIILNMMAKRATKSLNQHNQRMVATDMDWRLGEGSDEIRGPAEALVMFLAGRRKAALPRLSGAGVDRLR